MFFTHFCAYYFCSSYSLLWLFKNVYSVESNATLRLFFSNPSVGCANEILLNKRVRTVFKKVEKHCYRRIDVTDEAVINEFSCIEQIYKRFQAPFELNQKS